MKRMYGVFSVLILLAAYWFIRYPLFKLHGMIQWPFLLAVVAVVICCICIFIQNKTLPLFTASGYILGFVAGVLFHRNGVDAGGGTVDTLWIIWTVVMLCFLFSGVVVSIVRFQQEKEK